jgi:hypothetical protein
MLGIFSILFDMALGKTIEDGGNACGMTISGGANATSESGTYWGCGDENQFEIVGATCRPILLAIDFTP